MRPHPINSYSLSARISRVREFLFVDAHYKLTPKASISDARQHARPIDMSLVFRGSPSTGLGAMLAQTLVEDELWVSCLQVLDGTRESSY